MDAAEPTYLKSGSDLSAHGYDVHVVKTIDRLQCLRQLIGNQRNFEAGGRELLQWCSDLRAFQTVFEPYLMECLDVVRQCARNVGCDLDLSYRLLAICSANSDKFSQRSAGLLRCWSEDLGKALLQRHDSSAQGLSSHSCSSAKEAYRSEQAAAECPMQPGMQQPMLRKQYSTGDGGQMGWPMDGRPPGAPGHNGLSVVTTVWGMTPGTQTPSARHPAPPGFENMPMYQRGPSGQVRSPNPPAGYAPQQQPGFYRQTSMPSGPGPGMTSQYRTPYNQSQMGNPEYQPPPGALNAAAMVAAAATATATATATASMMMQQDPQMQYHRQPTPGSQHPSQMGSQYGVPQYGNPSAMRVPTSGGMMVSREMAATGQMAGGPMPSQQALGYRRPMPYSTHQQVMLQRKQQYTPNTPQYGAMTPQPTPYNQTVHGGGAQYPPHIRHPAASGMMMQSSQPVTYSNGAPPPYAGTGPYPPHLANRTLHPAYPNGYPVPQNTQDIKPVIPTQVDDIQLTFPIRDGVILPPFRLEHNLNVTQHSFNLKEQVYHTLMSRNDSEIQLKCFHHDDRSQAPNWPLSVSISVNGRPLHIERSDRAQHKPLYLKNVCIPGKNTLTISVCACCCSHLFVLQLVHRPSVNSILSGLVKKRVLPAEHCINKIKANFANTNASGLTSAEADGVEQTSEQISLKCPITFRRIVLPARGNDCRHIQCFDLQSYLQMNAERGQWRCPVCSKSAMLDGLEIDQYMWGIVRQLGEAEADEINIDANASWKPNLPKVTAKEEDSKDLCMWMGKVYSPSSTKLPSVGSYDGHVNPMSPYPTPPNSQGSNSLAHFSGGVYDVGFNSPPDFTGPMSNRSDMSENDKRLAVLQRQQSGIASPSQGPPSNAQVPASGGYSMPPGGPASNAPAMMPSGPASNMAPCGPPSNAPMSQGPPSNAPASQGPPSNAPASHGGPASNAPVGNNSPPNAAPNTATSAIPELPADISDLVNNASLSNDNSNLNLQLDQVLDADLLAYFGPQESELTNNENNSFSGITSTDDDEILALLASDS